MNYILYIFNKRRFKKNNKTKEHIDNRKSDYFDFGLISKYFYNVIDYKESFHVITDKIKTDLDIDEIFAFIDRTSSKIGQQFLYFKIRTVETIEKLQQFEKLINIFENKENKSIKFRKILSKLNDNDAYYFEELINREQIKKPKWFYLTYFLSIASILFICLSFVNQIFIFVTLVIFLTNLVIHYSNKAKLNYYLTAVSVFNKSIKIAKLFEKDEDIKEYYKDLSFLQSIYKIQNKVKFISFEKQFSNNEFAAIAWSIFELIKILFNIEIILFYSFIDNIVKEKENIRKLFCFIGEIDTSISVANLRSDILSTCKPEFTKNKNIEVKDIIHPLIKDCVPNSLKLHKKSLLLTVSCSEIALH